MNENNTGLFPKVGIGSYAYRYGIGAGAFVPKKPMTAMDFLDEAYRLGYGGVQLCENLCFDRYSDARLLEIKHKAEELGLFIEIGMKGLTRENMDNHLRIAGLMSCRFIRIVVGSKSEGIRQYDGSEAAEAAEVAEAVRILKKVLPYCKSMGISIGLENHFDFPAAKLAEIVEEVNDSDLGLIFDTTNGIGFIEKPQETLALMKDHIFSVHMKDYIIKKVEAGYFMTGTVMGEGLLDCHGILASVSQMNPNTSIILEMTIRREESMSEDETLLWEKASIEESTRYLNSLLNELRAAAKERI